MKKIMLAVYDSKAAAYGMPFCADTIPQGIRDFGDAVADEKTMFHRHPEDYSLFVLGVFNVADGSFESETAPRQVVTALDFFKDKE